MRKLVTALAVFSTLALPAWADGFYDGKTITYIIATNPGGNYDAYSRLIGRHLEEELGASKIIFKNLPGAGHIIGANTLAASKPDGLTVGTFNTGLIYAQILKRKGLSFDLNDLSWIGKAAADARAVVLSNESGMSTFDDLLNTTKRVNLAASGIGSASFTETKMLMDAFSLNVKMIPGYKGNEAEMAMLRGEVVGQIGSLSALSPFVETGNGTIAVYLGGKLQPQAIEFAKSDKAKSIVNLITAMSGLGRLTAAPGGVPAPVLKELRDGYMAVMQSADFLAEAKKLGLPIDAANGEDVTRLVRAALQQSPETVKIIAEALDIEIPSITANSEILSLEDKNKVIEFNSGDVVVKAKISGSRTKITIDGADADRKALNVGMSCEIIYDPNHEKFEPSVMDCSS